MTYAVKKIGTYTKTDDRKRRALARLLDENGALHTVRLLKEALAHSNDRHAPWFASKLKEAIEIAELSDEGFGK